MTPYEVAEQQREFLNRLAFIEHWEAKQQHSDAEVAAKPNIVQVLSEIADEISRKTDDSHARGLVLFAISSLKVRISIEKQRILVREIRERLGAI